MRNDYGTISEWQASRLKSSIFDAAIMPPRSVSFRVWIITRAAVGSRHIRFAQMCPNEDYCYGELIHGDCNNNMQAVLRAHDQVGKRSVGRTSLTSLVHQVRYSKIRRVDKYQICALRLYINPYFDYLPHVLR